MPRKTTSTVPFQKKLVLNQWMLGLLGFKDVKDFEGLLTIRSRQQHYSEEGFTRFCQDIRSHLLEQPENGKISRDEINAFDENITQHTRCLNKSRKDAEIEIKWKYFQYLALLFTEIYLYRYFSNSNTERLQEELNRHVDLYNRGKQEIDQIDSFEESDLRRIAFFQATGSGKTLQMHVNIKQFQHYLAKYEREHGHKHQINNIILLTPNEGLSQQHLNEFQKSGIIGARIFKKENNDRFFGQKSIEIIEIQKLVDKSEGKNNGKNAGKTVPVESFGNNNFVLIDEGHRGSQGEKWMKRREELSQKGFAIEYSATFEQAVASNKNKELEQQYAKSILFNYSYRYFYSDGYGKNYKILNLDDSTDRDPTKRLRYLTACFLTFYQQMRIFDETPPASRRFNIARPLLVLVGDKVQTQNSHIKEYLVFLGNFVKNQQSSINEIKMILQGQHGMSAKQKDIFENSFDFLPKDDPEEIFADLKKRLFNSENGMLTIEHLKGSAGEIALRLGDADPFGVINIGKAADFAKDCKKSEENGTIFISKNREFSKSYFEDISEDASSITILMGAKKFTEGWNSWRVSTMGLMHVGKSEGSEIIQLFGRGVRLKGKNFSLKRSHEGEDDFSKGEDNFSRIKKIETLNIFGIQANYMENFNKFLEREGGESGMIDEYITLPVLLQNDVVKDKKLKVLRVKEGMDYKKSAACPILIAEQGYFQNHKVVINWYPKIQCRTSQEIEKPSRVMQYKGCHFKKKHLALLDIDKIFFDLGAYKKYQGWHNMIISKEKIKELLLDKYLYLIEIPEEKMEFGDNMREDISRWQEIATVILKKYVERFYKFRRAKWENNYLEYQTLQEKDANLLWSKDSERRQYVVTIREDKEDVIKKIKELRKAMESKSFKDALDGINSFSCGDFIPFSSKNHLYTPLIHVGEGDHCIKVMPVALNKGEKIFVQDLTKYVQSDKKNLIQNKEVFLLRNQSRGVGIGFFEEGEFYPDFILWIVDGEKQYVSFVDPHGMNFASLYYPKLKFSQKIKEIEKNLCKDNDGYNATILNSFIISTTSREDLSKERLDDILSKNILFQDGEYIEEMITKILG